MIGNKSASGTEILDDLAEEEITKGHMIVYTSADSVLQICGNGETFGVAQQQADGNEKMPGSTQEQNGSTERLVSLPVLYRCCEIARELPLKDEWKVDRVIARPYVGRKRGEFRHTANRHDYALDPSGPTVLTTLKEAGYSVTSVGMIYDIFNGAGLSESHKSEGSVHGMEQTIELADRDFEGLCFVNLVDFDALWGHRR